MTPAGDHVLATTMRLVKHCQHTQHLLQSVLDCCDAGMYDPVADRHAVRLPGGLVRAMRSTLEEAQRDASRSNELP